MRHVHLTCKNHPQLRWSCKSIAFSGDGHGYNGCRNIFFLGEPDPTSPLRYSTYFADRQPIERGILECDCPPSELIYAPEERAQQASEGGL